MKKLLFSALFIVLVLSVPANLHAYSPDPYFVDVPDTHWAFAYVQRLFEAGITTGCDATHYCPANNVTRAQMAKFIMTTIDYIACAGNDANDIMVKVGSVCVDKYETSVWSGPSGGTQYGSSSDNYPCSDNGNDCSSTNPIYARSQSGVTPSRYITWFQSQQACAMSGKRLLTNAEWQMAAAGTPDPGTDNGTTDCAVSGSLSNTGSRSSCVSNWGVNDMVGNLWEWVADWMQDNEDIDGGSTSTSTYGSDWIVGIDEADPGTDRFPAAIFRGGCWFDVSDAGVFALDADFGPSGSYGNLGFRCAR